MTEAPGDHLEATVRAAIKRFNDGHEELPGVDQNGAVSRFVLSEIVRADGRVLAVGNWEAGADGAEPRRMPMVLSWRFTEEGDLAGIETFGDIDASIAAAEPGA